MARIDVPNDAARRKLDRLGLDLTEHAREGFREALLYSAADDEALQKARLSYRVTVADVAAADRQAILARSGRAAPPVRPERAARCRVGGSSTAGWRTTRRT